VCTSCHKHSIALRRERGSIDAALEESDVDGAQLKEPLEARTMHQLQ